MSTNAVLNTVKNAISGAGAVFDGQSIESHIMPSPTTLQTATTVPRVYIWPQRVRKALYAMYGPVTTHTYCYDPLLLHVRQVVEPVEATMNGFVALVDALSAWLATGPLGVLPQTITDPATGSQSQLTVFAEPARDLGMSIGVSTTYDFPRRLGRQPVVLVAHLSVSAAEQASP